MDMQTPQRMLRAQGQRRTGASGMLRRLLAALDAPAVEFALWDGEIIAISDETPIARIGIADRRTLLRFVLDPEMEFGEAYTEGRITVEGDLVRLLEEVYRRRSRRRERSATGEWLSKGWRWARSNTVAKARRNVHHHYDLGNEFYARWLDDSLSYSCAYFPTPAATLAEAQIAKMHHVSRKLRLQPGQSVIEAGCGWGSLALHMARHFGVRVTAFNVSHEQILYARERARAAGLTGQVEYVEDDYRNITGSCDAFVSVGMLEHVGTDHYRELGQVVRRVLKPSGYGFIHSIGRIRPVPLNAWISKRVFPGAYVPSLKEMMDVLEAGDFAVLDVENLRLHYARTLECWRTAFEQARGSVSEMLGENFVRMWRLYLAGSVAAFRTGELQLFQILFAPRTHSDVPWTRQDLYRD